MTEQPIALGTARVPRRADNVQVSDLREGVVIYDPSTRTAHHLNAVATLVWELVDGARTVGDIETAVSTILETDAATTTSYVAEALDALTGHGVVR